MAKSARKKSTGKRELTAPRGDKRYIRRDKKGRIAESDDQGKSLRQDVKKKAKKKAKPGYGDKGDQPKRKTATKKSATKKSATKKSATKKSAPKKAASKKSGVKKAARKKKAAKKK